MRQYSKVIETKVYDIAFRLMKDEDGDNGTSWFVTNRTSTQSRHVGERCSGERRRERGWSVGVG